jgi:plastocyanin
LLPAASPSPSPLPTADAGASAAPESSAGEETVGMVDNRFVPTRLTVAAGSTVTWSNHGNNAHTVTSLDGLWDSGTLLHDDQFRFTFTTPGTYRFICRQHLFQGMGGTIVVEARPPPTP